MKTLSALIVCLISVLLSHSFVYALVQENDLQYIGTFRVPFGILGGDSISSSISYGGTAVAYNPTNNSLIMAGNIADNQNVVELSIPTPVISANIEDYPTASVLKVPTDICEGNRERVEDDDGIAFNHAYYGGFMYYNNLLYGSVFAYYDSGKLATRSHFTVNPEWITGGTNFNGHYKMGVNPEDPLGVNGGFVGGYMTEIPPEWRTALGGPALTGMDGIAILSRTSLGPSAWVFDPADIAGDRSVLLDAKFLLGYPESHPTLGTYDYDPHENWNRATHHKALIFPEGTDSLLYFGKYGLGITRGGDSCYGFPTDDPALHLTKHPVDTDVDLCYDEAILNKGGHAYPYVNRVMAYDANELAAVKAGTKQPWDILPYAKWYMSFPFQPEDTEIGGVGYDAGNKIFYISELMSDGSVIKPTYPLIHVFKLSDRNIPKLVIANIPDTVLIPNLRIEGSVTPNLISNSPIVSVTAPGVTVNGTDSWFSDVVLTEGLNTFYFTATDSVGETTLRIYDTVYNPPAVQENKPSLSITTQPQTTTSTSITITGTATPNATSGSPIASVTSLNVTVTGTTSWSATVPLVEGVNTFDFTVTDLAGVTSTTSVTITRTVTPGDAFLIKGCSTTGINM